MEKHGIGYYPYNIVHKYSRRPPLYLLLPTPDLNYPNTCNLALKVYIQVLVVEPKKFSIPLENSLFVYSRPFHYDNSDNIVYCFHSTCMVRKRIKWVLSLIHMRCNNFYIISLSLTSDRYWSRILIISYNVSLESLNRSPSLVLHWGSRFHSFF